MAARPTGLEFARAAAAVHRAMNGMKEPAVVCAGDGGVFMVAQPGTGGDYPSNNPNCTDVVCDPGGVTGDVLDKIAGFYRDLGVPKYFVFISPDSADDGLDARLAERGLERWPWTEYPTLVRARTPVGAVATDFTVRLATGDDTAHRGALEEIYGGAKPAAGFLRTLGRPGLSHYLAFLGERPVAAAFLRVDGDYGYLGSAWTHPEFRGRGGQSALIAARLRRAAEMGCSWCLSETLTMLTSSLGNLKRAGFEEAFRWSVYGWGRASSA